LKESLKFGKAFIAFYGMVPNKFSYKLVCFYMHATVTELTSAKFDFFRYANEEDQQ
jgi:hypothetical protein